MHPKALEKLRKQFSVALHECEVVETWPVFQSYFENVEKIASEVIKHKKEWLTNSDVHTIFLDHVYKSLVLRKAKGTQLNGLLVDILGEEGINELVERLLSYFEGIPRSYSVYVPIPAIPTLMESVDLSDSIRVERIASRQDFPGTLYPRRLLGLDQDEVSPVYFILFKVKGFCGSKLSTSAAVQALSSFKIAMQQGMARQLFRRKKDSQGPIGLGLFGPQVHTVRKHFLVAADDNPSATAKVELELTIEICRFLESHEFAADHPMVIKAVESNELPKLITKYFDSAAKLLTAKSEDSARIKLASEWAFDAYLNDSLTMSFIQTCVALEALYGDGNEGDNLTKTLADRCAYLIGGTIEGRRTIRNDFRELYKIRSKIVHGCVGSLAPEEERHLDWGKSILEFSIFKEIKNLALE